MDNEKIVTIHIDEYLELKNTIELYRNKISYLQNEIKQLKKRKWYHLF